LRLDGEGAEFRHVSGETWRNVMKLPRIVVILRAF